MADPELHVRARLHAEALIAVAREYPFGPDWEVYKVRGKVFMLLTEVTGEPVVTLKAAPEDGVALRQTHPGITRGYHMNKKHWITLTAGGELSDDLVRELVTDSYLLVVEKMPKRDRPVDPSAWVRR